LLLIFALHVVSCGAPPPGRGAGEIASANASAAANDAKAGDASSASSQQGAVQFRVETVAGNLEVPWSIVFAPDGRVLFTERPGRIRIIEGGRLRPEPLATIQDVEPTGESGLMGLTLHPQFAQTRLLYLAYAYRQQKDQLVRVVRYRETARGLDERRVIIEGIPAAQYHAGTRLRFGADNKLYITTGDATDRNLAQQLNSLAGKTLRLNDDGTVPPDNPFAGQPNARPEIFSYGHRNAQGLDFQPGTNLMFQTEHGPSGFDGPGGGDEVNIVERGKNYGWPLVHHRDTRAGTEPPLLEYTPAIAPASGMFYRGGASGAADAAAGGFPQFRGNFFFGNLRGECIVRVVLEGRRVVSQEKLLERQYGRIRDIAEAPDGAIYFSTSNRDGRGKPAKDDDRILRLVPVSNSSSAAPTATAEVNASSDSPIRKVDFKNFSYPFPEQPSGRKAIRLRDGEQPPPKFNEHGIPLDNGYRVVDVSYADLTGDGVEEAIVVMGLLHAGTSNAVYVYIYGAQRERPQILWSFESGDRAEGGLRNIYADNGELVVELDGRNKIIGTDLYADDGTNRGACCPDAFTRTRYRWRDGNFRQQGTPEVVFRTDAVPRS
jgi:glucose/arabinose dehydrogenase